MGRVVEVLAVERMGCCAKIDIYCPHCRGRVAVPGCGQTRELSHCGGCGMPYVVRSAPTPTGYEAYFPEVGGGDHVVVPE